MSAGCSQVISSLIKASVVPILTCNTPVVVHNLRNTVAAAIGDTTITLALDTTAPAPTTGAYTVTSRFPLCPGTILYLGSAVVTVLDPTNGTGVYPITTTGIVVNVKRLTVAIPINTSQPTYFAIPLCLKSASVTTSSTQVDNTTNCTGTLFTSINVGYAKVLEMMGFLASGDYGFQVIDKLGTDLKSAYFAIDYDGRFFHSGTVQLTEPSITESAVKNLAGFTIQGQIQSIVDRYQGYVATQVDFDALVAIRKLYGMRLPQEVYVSPLA